MKLTILIGISRVGKTTLSKFLSESLGISLVRWDYCYEAGYFDCTKLQEQEGDVLLDGYVLIDTSHPEDSDRLLKRLDPIKEKLDEINFIVLGRSTSGIKNDMIRKWGKDRWPYGVDENELVKEYIDIIDCIEDLQSKEIVRNLSLIFRKNKKYILGMAKEEFIEKIKEREDDK